MKSQVNLLIWILSLTLYCTIPVLNETLRAFNLWQHYCNHTLLYWIHMDVFHLAKTIEIRHKTNWTILLLHTFTFHWHSIFSLVMNKEFCKGKELWITLSSRLCHVQPVCWLACVGHYPSLFIQYHFLLTFTAGSDLNIEGNALKGTSVRACFLCSGLHCVLQKKMWAESWWVPTHWKSTRTLRRGAMPILQMCFKELQTNIHCMHVLFVFMRHWPIGLYLHNTNQMIK